MVFIVEIYGLEISSNMFWLEHNIPSYLTSKSNIVKTVVFTALFALAFINFYAPFGVNKWFHLSQWQLFFYSSLVILTGVMVIVISRIIMYYFTQRYPMNYIQFLIWIFVEIVSMAFFYALFVKYALNEQRLFIEILKISVKNTALVLLIPYSVLSLYFSYQEKSKKLELLEGTGQSLERRKQMIPFHDENNNLKFSIKQGDLLYLEAMDNYVTIFYESTPKMAKYVIRNSLKNLEQRLSNLGIIRCHRSYLVNFEKVKLLKKEKEGLFLELDSVYSIKLPVSKTYVGKVSDAFSKYTAVN